MKTILLLLGNVLVSVAGLAQEQSTLEGSFRKNGNAAPDTVASVSDSINEYQNTPHCEYRILDRCYTYDDLLRLYKSDAVIRANFRHSKLPSDSIE